MVRCAAAHVQQLNVLQAAIFEISGTEETGSIELDVLDVSSNRSTTSLETIMHRRSGLRKRWAIMGFTWLVWLCMQLNQNGRPDHLSWQSKYQVPAGPERKFSRIRFLRKFEVEIGVGPKKQHGKSSHFLQQHAS